MALFQIENLTFFYPGAPKPALSGINLTIEEGSYLFLTGQTGSGKTTLLRCLKPILSPRGERSGRILFRGTPLEKLSPRDEAARIGYVFQDPDDQIACDKVWHELAFGLENLGLPTEEIRARVAEMAGFFGMESWFERDVHALSGGQKQMLNLASVMVLRPDVLLLDEPTARLDPNAAREFLNTVRMINRDIGTTIVLVSHDAAGALEDADRIFRMEDGVLLEDSRAAEQFSATACVYGLFRDAGLPAGEKVPLTGREGREWLSCQIQEIRKGMRAGGKKGSEREKFVEPEPSQASVLAKDLWFRYDRSSPDILRGLSFQAYPGEAVAVLGANGAGKTTLLKILAGLTRPYHGKVIVRAGRTGLLVQDPQTLFSEESAREELEKAKAPTERVEEMLDRFSLTELADRHPYDLSGGEQEKLALAEVLLWDPDVLLLDEPTLGLDEDGKKAAADILHELCQSGKTVIFATHDLDFAACTAVRSALLFRGEVTAEGETRTLLKRNLFYTTAASRMARSWYPDAVLPEDILACALAETEDGS